MNNAYFTIYFQQSCKYLRDFIYTSPLIYPVVLSRALRRDPTLISSIRMKNVDEFCPQEVREFLQGLAGVPALTVDEKRFQVCYRKHRRHWLESL